MKKKIKILIIGYGSIGKKHLKVLRNIKYKKEIFILSERNFTNKIFVNRYAIKNLNPDYIIICSKTSSHLRDVKFIEKTLEKKIVLIEKPIFNKLNKFKPSKNKYFVNYQLRLHPIIKKLKEIASNKKILNLQVSCNSFLPAWRNTEYKKSYSSQKRLGGGVLLDLSHELDYILWIFKNVSVNYSKIEKNSKLNINSEDHASVLGKISNEGILHLNLSYFSRISNRKILLDCNDFSFEGDLIKNYFKFESSKKKITKFYKISQSKLLSNVHRKIIEKDFKDLCSFEEGLQVLKLIKKIKKV